MKKIFLLVIGILMLTNCQNSESNQQESTPNQTKTEKKEFKSLDVDTEWTENPFSWFKGDGLLLAVGDKESNNAMTIGWGSLGNVWSKIGENTVTVYVAEGRYTYQFMEKYNYFTVMAFNKGDKRILGYMGTHSGRDGNKAEALGLHTLYTEHGTPYYEEASLVLECRIIYKAPFQKEGMCEEAQKFYENFEAGVHHMYIGNIIGAWIKD